MWYYVWVFCGLYPAVYIWFAESWWTVLFCSIVVLAWDLTNGLEYNQSADD